MSFYGEGGNISRMIELLDTYDIDGNFLGVRTREWCHSGVVGVYHKPVWVWVKNTKGDILLQKRARSKREAGKWDLAVAGHVNAGEKCIDACVRETKEELGIDTKRADYRFLKQIVREDHAELVQVYLLQIDVSKEAFVLQEDEIEDAKWFSYAEFEVVSNTDEFSSESKKYREWVLEVLK